MGFKKGQSGNPNGRPKGPTKFTIDIKAAIEGAFQKVGGIDYLAKIAKSDPAIFCALVGKLVPRDVALTTDIGPNLAALLRDITDQRRLGSGHPVVEGRSDPVRDGGVVRLPRTLAG